jgi:hypothetical protein
VWLQSVGRAFKSGAVPPCGAASSIILDEGHRPSRSVHSFFRAVRVFLSGLVDSSAFQEVSLGREVSIVFTSNGPLIYRWPQRRYPEKKLHHGNRKLREQKL